MGDVDGKSTIQCALTPNFWPMRTIVRYSGFRRFWSTRRMMRLSLFCMALLTLVGCVQSPSSRTAAAPVQPQPPEQDCAPPVYPAEALQARMSGVSMMAFLVGSDGAVREARLLKSSGHVILDQAAQAALRLCRFAPTRKDGQPVAAWQPVQYAWALP
jgi:protein TonB